MSYLKDREIWLSNVPTGNPPAGYFWKFIQNGKVVVRDSSGNNQIMVATSGSQAITGSLTVTGGITGTVSSASYIEYSNVANKPALVSGSEQITYSGLTGIPSGIVSGSSQVSFNGIVDKPTLVSGSSQVTYSGLTGIPSGIVSGSAQISDFGIFATTGSNGFNGNQSITGSLTVTGQVVAQTLNVQQVTSSIVYSSGSNVFGNSLANIQQFTGSLQVSGSTHYITGNTGIGTTNAVANFTVKENETTKAIVLYGRTSDNLARIDFYRADETTFAGRIQLDNGTNSNVSVRAQGNLRLQAGGSTDRLLIDTTGNVGIGTTSPGTLLHLQNSSGPTLRMVRTSNRFDIAADNDFMEINARDASTYMIFKTADTERLRIKSNGDIKIQSGNLLGWSDYSAGSTGVGLVGSSENLLIYTAGAEKMRITSAGLVSIGNTSPSANGSSAVLDIGNGNGGTLNLRDTNTGITAEGFHQIYGGDNRMYLYAGGSGASAYMQFYTNDSERLRITPEGYLGTTVTSTTVSSGDLLGVLSFVSKDASTYSSGGITNIRSYATTTYNTGNVAGDLRFYVSNGLQNTTGTYLFGTEVMRIASDGSVGFNSNSVEANAGLDRISIGHSGTYGWIQSWNATPMYLNRLGNAVYAGTQRIDNNSDERIKENISSINNALNIILSLQGKKFNMLDEDNVLRYGFIAQEVQPYLPDFVKESDRSFKKDDINIEHILTLENSGGAWASILVEAIKEQQTLIESLKSRIEILEQ